MTIPNFSFSNSRGLIDENMKQDVISLFLTLTEKEFAEFLKSAGPRLVVVNFTAKWCGPCKIVRPFLYELAVRYENVLFCIVDVDLAEDVAVLCNIVVVPTFQFFMKGDKIFEVTGPNTKKLEEKIGEFM
ncbi:thioredoxin-like [Protobothrops mucrosquamatus]|uniref:thioredoxin-like n=1 Tax=Protobothrops mucrosquamatus TaxID=103944 RepID=UPI0007756967|nr:thioredoxin-like [Protobothrops mucrosquamatus]